MLWLSAASLVLQAALPWPYSFCLLPYICMFPLLLQALQAPGLLVELRQTTPSDMAASAEDVQGLQTALITSLRGGLRLSGALEVRQPELQLLLGRREWEEVWSEDERRFLVKKALDIVNRGLGAWMNRDLVQVLFVGFCGDLRD